MSIIDFFIQSELRDAFAKSLEEVGKAYIDNILEYGDDTWYDWSCRHWGTKWNPSEARIFDDEIEFETAWSAPFQLLKNFLVNFLNWFSLMSGRMRTWDLIVAEAKLQEERLLPITALSLTMRRINSRAACGVTVRKIWRSNR